MAHLIDTHQHLIYPDTFTYPWITGVPALQRSYTLKDYKELTSGLDISQSLFMEVDVAETDIAAEARFFAQEAEKPEFSLEGVIASCRPEAPSFAELLEACASPRLKGLRRVLHVVDDAVSQSPLFRENISRLAEHDLPFDICMLPGQYPLAAALVDACPKVTFILDHCGNPNLSEPGQFKDWAAGLRDLASRPNLNAKLSGIVASAPASDVSPKRVFPYLDETLAAFGPDRLLWGSDWPVCTLSTALPDWIRLFRSWVGTLSASEQERICHANATRLYRL